jgi:hypothetical protein
MIFLVIARPAAWTCAPPYSPSAALSPRLVLGTPPERAWIVNGQENKAVIFDKASGKWLNGTPDGGSPFVSDKDQAIKSDTSQLKAYIRDHELEYLRYSLVTEPAAPAADS